MCLSRKQIADSKKKNCINGILLCIIAQPAFFFFLYKRRRYEGTFEQNRHPGTAMEFSLQSKPLHSYFCI